MHYLFGTALAGKHVDALIRAAFNLTTRLDCTLSA